MRLATDCEHKDQRHEAKGMCKACYLKTWRATHQERHRRHNRDYGARNREEIRRRRRERYWADPLRARFELIKRTYGISRQEFEALYKSQSGRCAVCSSSLPEAGKGVHVDHDHVTGLVRGLLCRACNTGIGFLQDSQEICIAAARYLGGPCFPQ